MIVTLPFLLLVMDFWPFKRNNGAGQANYNNAMGPRYAGYGLIIEKIPMLMISVGLCVLATVGALPYSERISNALLSCMLYLRDAFWPLNLCVYYPLADSLKSKGGIIAMILFALISTLTILFRKKHGWALSGWLWYAGMLVPVIGIVQVGAQSRADRYTYLPLIGIYIILAWMLANLAERSKPAKVFAVSVSLLALLGIVPLTHRQIGYWVNSETLYERTLAVTDNNGVIHYNLGLVLFKKNRIADAIPHFMARLESFPADAWAHNMVGLSLIRLGKPDQAIPYFNNAIQIKADYLEAYMNLAALHKRGGAVDAAIKVYQEALLISPDDPGLHNNLATTLVIRCELSKAKEHLKIAFSHDPGNRKAQENIHLIEQIEHEIKESIPESRATNAQGASPRSSVAEMVEIIKRILNKYKVSASERHIQEMVRHEEMVVNIKKR